MPIPNFAPLPPANVRSSLAQEEWEACLDAWITLCDLSLRLSTDDFVDSANDDDSLPAFLNSFYQEYNNVQSRQDATLTSSKGLALRKLCFKLVTRAYTEWSPISKTLLSWDFLAHFCHAHLKSSTLSQVMNDFWQTKGQMLMLRLQKQKEALIKALESQSSDDLLKLLTQLASILHASADIGSFFMTGSDFLDALVSAYSRIAEDSFKKALSTVAYLGLLSLLRAEESNVSLLSDHLYTLKIQADKSTPGQSILVDIITNTSFVTRVVQFAGQDMPDRLSKLLASLDTYRNSSVARIKKRTRRSRSKGKGRQRPQDDVFHIHKMSLVTQIQDLFPDLGSGFVLQLLDEYDDNVEQVTAHLLDDSLPPHLASLDRSNPGPSELAIANLNQLAPRPTPPPPETFIPERRTIFDDDELDRLEFDTSRLHIGKKDRTASNDEHPNKAAILSALAAFDSDDDERDDTYDVDDVGGTVDTSHPDGEPGPIAKVTNEENDMALLGAYKANPELFGRTFDVRRGQARQALKKETGMTDEAIEGWAIMLQRDPKRLRRLEAQSGLVAFDGKQPDLPSTAYRESPGNTETEDSDAGPAGGRGGFRGRGRGRGRGGRGGNVAGPTSDPSTAQAQRRKEASKGSRANHNRRDQRARKMARGGFAG